MSKKTDGGFNPLDTIVSLDDDVKAKLAEAVEIWANKNLIPLLYGEGVKMTDQEYYEKQKIANAKRQRALAKARNRGKIAEEWFRNNKLTRETQPEFNNLMKKADYDFDKAV